MHHGEVFRITTGRALYKACQCRLSSLLAKFPYRKYAVYARNDARRKNERRGSRQRHLLHRRVLSEAGGWPSHHQAQKESIISKKVGLFRAPSGIWREMSTSQAGGGEAGLNRRHRRGRKRRREVEEISSAKPCRKS